MVCLACTGLASAIHAVQPGHSSVVAAIYGLPAPGSGSGPAPPDQDEPVSQTFSPLPGAGYSNGGSISPFNWPGPIPGGL
jgi:hypothetical protein